MPMLNSIRKVVSAAAAACCLAAGCRTLPPGTPPVGPIIVPEPRPPVPPIATPEPPPRPPAPAVVPETRPIEPTKPAIAPEPPPVVVPDPPPAAPMPMPPKAAVEYMLTSLATSCPEIGGAGAVPPAVANAFQVAEREVNMLPMDVWQSLIRMRLVRAVRLDDPTVAYRLESVLQRDPQGEADASGRVRYRWQMRLERLGEGGGERWRETVEFGIRPDAP